MFCEVHIPSGGFPTRMSAYAHSHSFPFLPSPHALRPNVATSRPFDPSCLLPVRKQGFARCSWAGSFGYLSLRCYQQGVLLPGRLVGLPAEEEWPMMLSLLCIHVWSTTADMLWCIRVSLGILQIGMHCTAVLNLVGLSSRALCLST